MLTTLVLCCFVFQKIKNHIGEDFDRYYCSEYVRAMETAALLELPRAEWIADFFLRERDQGILAGLSKSQRKELLPLELQRRENDSFYYAPPGGESIANACLRVNRVISQLRRSCSGFKVIAVCHGNIMWGFRICIEKLKQPEYRELIADPDQKLYNCHIIHYTRRDPVTGRISPHLDWMRSICPWDEKKTKKTNQWTKIHRLVWTNEDLLRTVEHIPQMVNNRQEEMSLESTAPPVNPERDPAEQGEIEADGEADGGLD
ncbi:phosphoglycerate mutase (2,3-diphosphoglycerate-dependent) [Balamuthia mandrillaris]